MLNSRPQSARLSAKGAQLFARQGRSKIVQPSAATEPMTSHRLYRAVTIFASSVQFFSFFFSGVVECIPLRSMHTTTHILFKQ